MKIAVLGCGRGEMMARIESAAAALGLHVHQSADSPAPVTEADGEGEILILGPEAGPQEAPRLVREWLEENPRSLAIVIEKRAGDRRDEVLKAGGFEVLPPNPTLQALHGAIGRAANWHARIERQTSIEKLQAITQLAAGVNHEINNPLTGLMGTAELILLENKALPEKLQRDVKTILTQARRIQTIVLRLKHLDHLRTVPYDHRESMIDLVGAEEEAPSEAGAAREEVILETPRLLVVDDNPLILDLIERLLAGRFAVDSAACPSDALSKLQYRDFNLVLVDLVMPEMDGLELLRVIRRMKPQQRVIMTSATGSHERLERSLSEGALGWIKKPFDFEKLEKRLWEALKSEGKIAPNGA